MKFTEKKLRGLGTDKSLVRIYFGKDTKVAMRRLSSEWSRLDDKSDQLRGKVPPNNTVVVTKEALDAIAWQVYTQTMEGLESHLHSLADSSDIEMLDISYDAYTEDWRTGLIDNVWSRNTTARTAMKLKGYGIDIPENSSDFYEARCLIAREMLGAHKVVLSGLQGDHTTQPGILKRTAIEVITSTNADASSLNITELHRKWEAERNPNPRTGLE